MITKIKKYWYLIVLFLVVIFMSKDKKPKQEQNYVSNLPENRDVPSTYDEQLTKNFRLKEFHSKDGASMPYDVYLNIKALAVELQKIRDYIDAPIKINSGYRSPAHNAAVGGASQSYHMKGMAADITTNAFSPSWIQSLIGIWMLDANNNSEQIYGAKLKKGGLGVYKNFTHYDIRGKIVNWNS